MTKTIEDKYPEEEPYWLCCGSREYPHPIYGCHEAEIGYPRHVMYGTKSEHAQKALKEGE